MAFNLIIYVPLSPFVVRYMLQITDVIQPDDTAMEAFIFGTLFFSILYGVGYEFINAKNMTFYHFGATAIYMLILFLAYLTPNESNEAVNLWFFCSATAYPLFVYVIRYAIKKFEILKLKNNILCQY